MTALPFPVPTEHAGGHLTGESLDAVVAKAAQVAAGWVD